MADLTPSLFSEGAQYRCAEMGNKQPASITKEIYVKQDFPAKRY